MIYHMEVSTLSRGKGRSLGASLSYISGKKIHDRYSGKTYRHRRFDLVQCRVYLPPSAPNALRDLQCLCDELNKAEKRKDARTGRLFICSLPNELMQASGHESSMSSFRRTLYLRVFVRWLPSTEESYHRIIRKAIPTSTLLFQHGRWGRRGSIPRKTVSTTNGPTLKYGVGLGLGYKTGHTRGATSKKRVSHESLRVQGVERKPTRHVSYVDLQRGERQRRIQAKELARELARLERNRELSARRLKPTPADRKGIRETIYSPSGGDVYAQKHSFPGERRVGELCVPGCF